MLCWRLEGLSWTALVRPQCSGIRARIFILWRIVLLIVGIGSAGFAVLQLYRSLQPDDQVNLLAPLMSGAAILFGGYFAIQGLVLPNVEWTIRPGRIEIDLTSPLDRRVRTFTPETVVEFTVRKPADLEGPPVWQVEMKARDGTRYWSRLFRQSDEAARLKAEMERSFYATAPLKPLPGSPLSTIATAHEAPVTPGGRVREL